MRNRLPKQANEWINRDAAISFSFEGKSYQGYAGDTITSALWANGEQVLGRSFKYHRARGVLSFANHDVNILMTDGHDTNIRADVTPLQANMQLTVVNTSGGVKHDRKRWLDKISAILPVGFYYKAFHKPKALFPFWENNIRKSAGLGKVNVNYPRTLKHKSNHFTDVLVVGAGMAGMTAAIKLAKAGLQVVLVDEQTKLGGSLNEDFAGNTETLEVLQRLLKKLSAYPNITSITQAYVAGYYADHYLPIITPTGMLRMRAKSVVVATGAFEQPPVFRNNDLPGVMCGTAAQKLMHRYAVKPFENGMVFTANDHGYRVALDMLKAGIKVAALVDLRSTANADLSQQLDAMGVKHYTGHCVYEARPNADKSGVKSVIVCPYSADTAQAHPEQSIEIGCDGIAMSAGWSPALALLYQAGTKMHYDDDLEQFVPKQLPAGLFAAGKVNGHFDLDARALDGERVAQAVIQYLQSDQQDSQDSKLSTPKVNNTTETKPSHPYPMVPHPKGKNFIDFDEDIQLKDFANAAQEGFDNIELMKRYTTFGMGPSQGKHGNMNAIRVLARLRQQPLAKVGSTTARPFYHPTPLGYLAGYAFQPYRTTAMHAWHLQAGAVFTSVGAWQRPAYYAVKGQDKVTTINAEVKAVREGVGMIDVSTLGKIALQGAQAAQFLERFYTGSFIRQKIGTTRYALALDESGVMMDDGLVARLAEDQFYLTTSTSNAAMIYREMQRWQQIWQMDITLVNVTGAYTAMNIVGPFAINVLTQLVLDKKQLLQAKLGDYFETSLANQPVKVMRVGFVSDTAFEIHVAIKQGLLVWNALVQAGQAYNIQPFGTDAQRILRLEMGHPLLGHDTDGLTNPLEANVSFALEMKKPFFVGQRSLRILEKKTRDKQLVAFSLIDQPSSQPSRSSLQECNLVIEHGDIAGRVTSIAWSPTLKRTIGFAYVKPTQAAIGTTFDIRADDGVLIKAEVVSTPFAPLKDVDHV